MPQKKININQKNDIVGFAVSNTKKGEQTVILTKGIFISDQQEFYKYTEQISNLFLAQAGFFIDRVCQFLLLVHKDLSVDIYVNDFPVIAEMRVKKATKKGQPIGINDIADIKQIRFEGIDIKEDDKIAYCFKIGWKFGLYFNFDPKRELEIDKLQQEIGSLYRYLKFQHIYKTLENEKMFEELQKDGWFPFIEILGQPFKELETMYQNKFVFENKIKSFVDSFDEERIKAISERWWSKKEFSDKKTLIEAGLDAYYKNDKNGFINCIKTLTSEIEGIVRLQYFDETNKPKSTFKELIKHVVDKGKAKSSENSLFLPLHFLEYLEKVFFADFDLSSGKVELSRHSSCHGVAKEEDYRKIKALQTILVLDQLFFYLG
ncbi:hypothetical protein KKF86_01795 [bacterium]|nr:hypothetical protein [bacterium]